LSGFLFVELLFRRTLKRRATGRHLLSQRAAVCAGVELSGVLAALDQRGLSQCLQVPGERLAEPGELAVEAIPNSRWSSCMVK
jgi:hypothetical protein